MDIFNYVRRAFDFFAGTPGSDEPWAQSEADFEEHFGVPYEAFAARLEQMSREQDELYRRTMDVNPEAAVLWVLAMEEV